jgi:hypothetical protein
VARYPFLMFLVFIGSFSALTIFTVAYPTIKERVGKAKYERPEDAI